MVSETTNLRFFRKTAFVYLFLLVTARSSGILKAKQKLGRTFNSDKLGGIAFKNFKTDHVQHQPRRKPRPLHQPAPASTDTAHAHF